MLCIVCCVVYCLLCITVLCCANNQMQLLSTKVNFFSIKTNLFVSIINFFLSDVGFSMSACIVRLMWPSLWWSRFIFGVVTPSFRWPDWAVVPPDVGAYGLVMQQTINILFINRFSQFLLQTIQQSAVYKRIKKINKMFNKTIWILTFFS